MTSEAPAPEASANERRRRLKIAAQLTLGVILGLLLAEAAFRWRDDGAFPHLARYVADPKLGVRLEPGTTQRLRVADNPTTTVHINAQGYRGADWLDPPIDAAPGTGEILVVGDSQVFGLGVEDDETFAHRLAELSGRPVINAGVPTYGPPEYLALTRELLAARRPESVVYVLHLFNDPFELERPNVERHAVWDGWAVRSETFAGEAGPVRAFPGRRWLMSRSHLIYALRRWWFEREELGAEDELGTPSEGTWHDLIDEGERELAARANTAVSREREWTRARTRAMAVDTELEATRRKLDARLEDSFGSQRPDWADEKLRRPTDIVVYKYYEGGRRVEVTASHIARAVAQRRRYIERLVEKQLGEGSTVVADLLREEGSLVEQRRALRGRLLAGPPSPPAPRSMFDDHLRELVALCNEYDAELTVVALPFDVQIDPAEWDKYGVDDPPDMRPSLVLVDELLANAESLGARAVDLRETLRAASPGAFLDADIHMTAKGHAAVAEAIAARLAESPPPPPLQLPEPGIPEGRTLAPLHEDWLTTREIVVAGSTAFECTTHIIDEWLRVRCGAFFDPDEGYCGGPSAATGIEVVEGGGPETMTLVTAEAATLVTPLVVGEPLRVRFYREAGDAELRVTWPLDEHGKPKFTGELERLSEHRQRPISAAAERACDCYAAVYGRKPSQSRADEPCGVRRCRELWGDEALAQTCIETWPNDCRALLGCMQHDPVFAPTCPAGSVHAFASNRCFTACDAQHACEAGTCTPYRGGGLCLD